MTNLDMLDELLDLTSDEYELSEWEIDFIESLNKQRDRPWSQKQIDKLQQIYRKAFA